jgi:GNAT superfamily N-acetyltransferase
LLLFTRVRRRDVLPPLAQREIWERRYAREVGAFSYKNCIFAELGREVIGMLHAFPMEEEPEETDEPVNPVLQPYTRLEVPGSHYVSFPEHRGRGLGTRMLEMAKE